MWRHGKKLPAMIQEKGPPQIMLAPWSWNSGLKSYEKSLSIVHSYSVWSVLLQKPKLTETNSNAPEVFFCGDF